MLIVFFIVFFISLASLNATHLPLMANVKSIAHLRVLCGLERCRSNDVEKSKVAEGPNDVESSKEAEGPNDVESLTEAERPNTKRHKDTERKPELSELRQQFNKLSRCDSPHYDSLSDSPSPLRGRVEDASLGDSPSPLQDRIEHDSLSDSPPLLDAPKPSMSPLLARPKTPPRDSTRSC
jgi:hypothetical protein